MAEEYTDAVDVSEVIGGRLKDMQNYSVDETKEFLDSARAVSELNTVRLSDFKTEHDAEVQDRELDLREKELELKSRELDIREKDIEQRREQTMSETEERHKDRRAKWTEIGVKLGTAVLGGLIYVGCVKLGLNAEDNAVLFSKTENNSIANTSRFAVDLLRNR